MSFTACDAYEKVEKIEIKKLRVVLIDMCVDYNNTVSVRISFLKMDHTIYQQKDPNLPEMQKLFGQTLISSHIERKMIDVIQNKDNLELTDPDFWGRFQKCQNLASMLFLHPEGSAVNFSSHPCQNVDRS